MIRLSILLVLLLAATVLGVACDSGSSTPEDFMPVEGEFFRLAVPEGWETDHSPPPNMPGVFRATGPESPGGGPPFTVIVSSDIGTADVEAATDQFLTGLRRTEGFELISNERSEVPGAEPYEDPLGNVRPDSTGARMLRYTRTDTDSGDTIHLIDIIARGPEEPPSLLRVGAPTDIWDEELAMQIIDTYELTR